MGMRNKRLKLYLILLIAAIIIIVINQVIIQNKISINLAYSKDIQKASQQRYFSQKLLSETIEQSKYYEPAKAAETIVLDQELLNTWSGIQDELYASKVQRILPVKIQALFHENKATYNELHKRYESIWGTGIVSPAELDQVKQLQKQYYTEMNNIVDKLQYSLDENITDLRWLEIFLAALFIAIFLLILIYFVIPYHKSSITYHRDIARQREVIKLMSEDAMLAYWWWEPHTKEGFASNSLKQMFGYTDFDMPNTMKAWRKLIHPDDLDDFDEKFNKHFAEENYDVFEGTIRCVHKDGSIVNVIYKVRAVEWRNKHEFGRIMGSQYVVTDLVKAKDEVKNLYERYQLTLNGINAGIWDWNIETDEETWSYRFYQLLGYEVDEIKASYDTFLKLLHPDDHKTVSDALRVHFSDNTPYKLKIRMKHKDGSYKWFETSGQVLTNDEGKPIRMAGAIISIEEEKMYEQRHKKSEFFLGEAAKMARIGGWEVDIEKQTVDWYDIIYDIHELPYSEQPTLTEAINHFNESDREILSQKVHRAIVYGEEYDVELKLITAKGKERWVRSIGKPMHSASGDVIGLRGVFQDIHEQKVRQLEFEEVKEKLKTLNETKDKLFSIIAHDMKRPVISLIGILQLGTEDLISKEEFNKHLNKIKHNLKTFSLSLDNLLEWARSQMQGFEVEKKVIDIKQIGSEVYALYEEMANQKNIKLENKLQPGVVTEADVEHVKLIVRNLINNAIKFTHEGGKITLSSGKNGSRVFLSVADTGVGISTDDLSQIMDRDKLFRTLGTNGEKGTGLGLGLCYDVVTMNNGTIEIQTVVGEGSNFSVYLPAVEEA